MRGESFVEMSHLGAVCHYCAFFIFTVGLLLDLLTPAHVSVVSLQRRFEVGFWFGVIEKVIPNASGNFVSLTRREFVLVKVFFANLVYDTGRRMVQVVAYRCEMFCKLRQP